MLINEGGLIRAIKRAYKAGGYTVLNTGNDVAIYTDHWFAMANRALLPRKVLATIVEHMGMIERDPAEHIGADVIDKDRLLWEADGEAVVINAVRKACSGWAKEWERAVWNALEGVDLHKEEAGR